MCLSPTNFAQTDKAMILRFVSVLSSSAKNDAHPEIVMEA